MGTEPPFSRCEDPPVKGEKGVDTRVESVEVSGKIKLLCCFLTPHELRTLCRSVMLSCILSCDLSLCLKVSVKMMLINCSLENGFYCLGVLLAINKW